MEIIAHRGASHDAPENTLAALDVAWNQGADAVEVDVQLTRTGRLMVIHDQTTFRTTGVSGRVSDLSVPELRRLDAGGWKAASYAGERIPTLGEAFDAIPSDKRFFVELKCGAKGAREWVKEFKRSRCKARQVIPIAYDQNTLKQIKETLPRLEVCQVIEFKRTSGSRTWNPKLSELIQSVKSAGLDGVDFGVNRPVTPALVETLHQANLKVYVWTADTAALARQCALTGVDGLTTNRPGWIREQLLHH